MPHLGLPADDHGRAELSIMAAEPIATAVSETNPDLIIRIAALVVWTASAGTISAR